MAAFTRFFILALPPLLGVTNYAGPAFLFAIVMVAVMLAAQLLAKLTREKLKEPVFFWVLIAQTTVLITVVDLVVSLVVPNLRAAWGIYLNLLALSPLVLVMPLERRIPFRPVALLVALLMAMGLVRESLGLGTLSLYPGVGWAIPFLHDYPVTLFATTAGAFFLASASLVVYRIVGPRFPSLVREPEERAMTPAPNPESPAVAVKPAPPELERRSRPRPPGMDATEWGEGLEEVMTKLASERNAAKKRVLVVGSGNGELVYYLAMLGLDGQRENKGFQFRIRGVDHFSTRVEAAVKGIYRDNLLEFIPEDMQERWLTRGKDDDRNLLRVANEPRLHIQFEVADLHSGQLTFPQPSNLTLIARGVELGTPEKTASFYRLVCGNLLSGGALVLLTPFAREAIPEGMKRTGTTVFRKA